MLVSGVQHSDYLADTGNQAMEERGQCHHEASLRQVQHGGGGHIQYSPHSIP